MEDIKIKRGMSFRTKRNQKCYIANVFMEGENQIITWRYWSFKKQRWFFETEFKDLFMIDFEYGLSFWINK